MVIIYSKMADAVVLRYRKDILSWFHVRDISVTNVMAMSLNLEKQVVIVDIKDDTVRLSDIIDSLLELLLSEGMIRNRDYKELNKILRTFMTKPRRRRSVPVTLKL